MCKEKIIFTIAGTMVLVGLGLGHWVSPGWLLLSAFPGLMLLIAGLTGYCTMTLILNALKVPACGDKSPAT